MAFKKANINLEDSYKTIVNAVKNSNNLTAARKSIMRSPDGGYEYNVPAVPAVITDAPPSRPPPSRQSPSRQTNPVSLTVINDQPSYIEKKIGMMKSYNELKNMDYTPARFMNELNECYVKCSSADNINNSKNPIAETILCVQKCGKDKIITEVKDKIQLLVNNPDIVNSAIKTIGYEVNNKLDNYYSTPVIMGSVKGVFKEKFIGGYNKYIPH